MAQSRWSGQGVRQKPLGSDVDGSRGRSSAAAEGPTLRRSLTVARGFGCGQPLGLVQAFAIPAA